MKVQTHAFYTFILDGRKLSASSPGLTATGTHRVGGWVGCKASLDTSLLLPGIKPWQFGLFSCRYTDRASIIFLSTVLCCHPVKKTYSPYSVTSHVLGQRLSQEIKARKCDNVLHDRGYLTRSGGGDRWVPSNGRMVISRWKPNKHGGGEPCFIVTFSTVNLKASHWPEAPWREVIVVLFELCPKYIGLNLCNHFCESDPFFKSL